MGRVARVNSIGAVPLDTRVEFLDLAAAHDELHEELSAAFHRVLGSGRFVRGAEGEAFENEFAGYCGAAGCVGVGTGLDAITLILRAAGVGRGDEVIVPAFTFIATHLAVTAAGATPIPADVCAGTLTVDPEAVEAAITDRTVALVAVHLYGRLADMEALRAVANRRRLLLVEDAAQAHGARADDGCRAGTLGDAAAFSFYPAKNLGALGDGGAVVSNDSEILDRVRRRGNYGSTIKYRHEELGTNSRLDEIQAALLRAKLPRLDDWNDRRRAVAERYLSNLTGLGVRLPPTARSEHVWHLFVVEHDDRDSLAVKLADQGVATQIHYPQAPHQSGAYEGILQGEHRVAEQAAETVLSLPIGPHMHPDAVNRVIDAIRMFER